MKNKTPIAFVHSADLDGMCSAALLRNFYGFDGVEICPVNYGDKTISGEKTLFDNYDIKNREVYICDFSFNPNLMKTIIEESKQTIWLDHHVSAVKDIVESGWFQKMIKESIEYENSGNPIPKNSIANKFTYLLNPTENLPYSGAFLTWAYLYHDADIGIQFGFVKNDETKKFEMVVGNNPVDNEEIDDDYLIMNTAEDMEIIQAKKMNYLMNEIETLTVWQNCPYVIKMISLFDTWKFTPENEMEVKIFQDGLVTLGLDFSPKMWSLWQILLSDIDSESMRYDLVNDKTALMEKIELYGTVAQQYQRNYVFPRIAQIAYPVKFELNGKTIKGIAANTNCKGSDSFSMVYDPEKHDFCIEYYFDKGFWNYSVYIMPDKIDKVSAIDIVYLINKDGGGHKGAAGARSESLYRKLV